MVFRKKISVSLLHGIVCWLSCVALGCSLVLLTQHANSTIPTIDTLWNWIDVGRFKVDFGILIDATSVIMVAVINTLSLIINLYSIGYMENDNSTPRFISYVSFLIFWMLILVTSPNLIQLFLGWQGVSFASYLLIGFWYKKPYANAAAIRTFIANNVGDVFFLLGIAGIYLVARSVDYASVLITLQSFSKNPPSFVLFFYHFDTFTFIGFALFVAIASKSAQFGFHTWLFEAIESPIPATALIHTTTIAACGIYLLLRFYPFFEMLPKVQMAMVFVGILTSIFGATVALVQTDIKRIFAYSTCSQLGLIITSFGIGTYKSAFFQLITHAFIKTLLFLGVGSIMYATSDERNIEKMGGLYKQIPFTYAMMWVGSLSLSGIPFLSGYYSQSSILTEMFLFPSSFSTLFFWIGIGLSFLTSLYCWRVIIKVFHGISNMDDTVVAHIHEAPWSMNTASLILAILSIGLGYFIHDYFIGQNSLLAPTWVLQAPIISGIFGIGVAFMVFYLYPSIPFYCSRLFKWVYLFFINKWFIDKLYERFFVHGSYTLGQRLYSFLDIRIIDRIFTDGFSEMTYRLGRLAASLQTGYIFHYVFIMLLGLSMVGLYFIFRSFL
jgi:NADH-quinone oxidoreductase subunit L